MTEVFVSYAREDEATARKLARVLEGEGFAVWWDRSSIPTGQRFDEAIEAALDATESAIVLWSSHSVGSRWVRDEARRALNRGILFPVLIGDVEPPLGFGSLQYVDLSAWDGGQEDAELDKLVAAISAVVSRRRDAAPLGPRQRLWASWNLPLIRKGSRGQDVDCVQRVLRRVGFDVDVDGIFGRGTRTAVRWFQASTGSTVDGVVGEATWNALLLNSWYRGAAEPLLAVGSKGLRVRSLQDRLVECGHVIDVDSVFGPDTQDAVRTVQTDHALDDDGIVGPDTRLALLLARSR
jgi:peptidoglycan hydrolase-like protein with peptidoglycan-binding domain